MNMRTLRALPTPQSGTLVELVAHQPRTFTFAELTSLSSAAKARSALARGEITRVLPDHYAATVHARSATVRCDAALDWAGPGAALAGTTALFAWGVLDSPPGRVHLTVPRDRRLRTPAWLKLSRVTYDPLIRHRDQMPVAALGFALAQGFGHLPADARATVMYRALKTSRATRTELAQALERMPRVPERRALLRRLEAFDAGCESWLEEASLYSVFNIRAFSHLIRQHTVVVEGREYRLDLFDPRTLTSIELDSTRWHSSSEHRMRDLERDADLATVGIQTVRLTYDDITQRPNWCRRMVAEILAVRAAR